MVAAIISFETLLLASGHHVPAEHARQADSTAGGRWRNVPPHLMTE
jgi:hypothetical protein